MPNIEFRLNGNDVSLTVRDDESLLDMLRKRLDIRSTKDGCQPQGQCGCCLAIIDGKAKTTCTQKAAQAAGREIVTLEGVDAADRDLLARSFVQAAGLQCGFCIPGIALKAKFLVDRDPNPSREAIAKAIDVHLCRCTGYVKIVDAIALYAAARRGDANPQPQADGRLGDRLQRYAGRETVLGERAYVDDLQVDGLLYGAVLLSPHPRARVLSILTEPARQADGVAAVVTAEDVPGERWYGLIEKDWPGMVAIGEEVRCVGDVIAAVAAESVEQARAALALVEVDYEVLTPVLTTDDALVAEAPQVNPATPNVLSETAFERGDASAAISASEHTVSGTWQTQRIEHLFLEPESALAVPIKGGGLHLYTQGQGIFDDRRQVAAFLNLDEEDVFVELVPNGGAFGGKEDMSIQAHTALLAHTLRRPVKITLTREESVRMHPKRHPIRIELTMGCDASGMLTAVRADMVGDTGAYASVGAKVLERAAGHACGPYRVANVHIRGRSVRTNNPPCGAMRGFGANQTAFAVESALDMLAVKAGVDPWEMRYQNAIDVGDTLTTGQIIDKGVGIKKTLESVRDTYERLRDEGRVIGLACGIKNTGLGNGATEWGKARLVVEPDQTITLYNGYTEMGQGLLTILVQFATEVTGLPAAIFTPKVDATYQLGCGQTTGSRATLLGGLAVKSAAEKLKAALDTGRNLADLSGEVFAGDIVIDDTDAPGGAVKAPKTHTTYGYATQLVTLNESGKVDYVLAAHDVGRAVNPDLCEGQIEGAIHMGLGYALTEELPCDNGMPVTSKLRELGVLRARDMPEVEVRLVEVPEPEGPFGAKGVGEIGLVPTAGAVANALFAFDGTRRFTLPMKGSPAADAISVGRIKRPRSQEWR